MKVMLLIPPTNLGTSYGKLKSFSNPQPSIGIAYIASVLMGYGYDVAVFDGYVTGSSMENILSTIKSYEPVIIGISALSPSAEIVYEMSKRIKNAFPQVKIVIGNMHASLFAEQILVSGYADFIVHGEGELTMLELVQAIEKGIGFEGVMGISFMKGVVAVHNQRRPHIADLDILPFPAWNIFPLEKYSTDPRTEIKRGMVEMQILATRGCPNQCTFCSSRTEKSLGAKYRVRSPQKVVDEMEYMYEKYGSKVFSFMDLAFPLLEDHATQLCEEIIARGLNKKIKLVTECRVKPLNQKLLFLMRDAGFVRINFGIESGNNDILLQIKKNFTVSDIKRAVDMAHDAGIEVDGMFMIGLPGETSETIKETIDFAIRLCHLRYAIFNIFVPYPGCELWDVLSKQGEIKFRNWSDFTSYPTYSGGKPVYVPEALSHQKLMELQKYAMRRFYLRPKFIYQEFKRFKLSKISEYYQGLRSVISR